MAGAQLVGNHLGVPADDGEQVIEIVRHAAGEAADALQFLGLQKLVFQMFVFGDVQGHTDQSRGLALGVEKNPSFRRQPTLDAIFDSDHAELGGELASGIGHPLANLPVNPLAIVRVDSPKEGLIRNRRLGPQSELLLVHGGPDEFPGLGTEIEGPDLSSLNGKSEALLGLAPLAPHPRLADFPFHGRRQAGHVAFHDIVVRATSHEFHGQGFSNAGRHDDKREVLSGFAENAQRRWAIEVGEAVVRENDVPLPVGERITHGAGVFDSLRIHGIRGFLQKPHHQSGIAFQVFDQ
jgi:hypothetical protein